MSGASSIEWCDATWNPVRGCSRVSEGCRNCYAERHAARFSGSVKVKDFDEAALDETVVRNLPFRGFAERTKAGARWTGRVELIPAALDWPLRKMKPLRIFVNSMSDLFHERLSGEAIAAVFGVMAAAPQHTFQVLTKRPERMLRWFAWLADQAADLRASVGVKPPSGFSEPSACVLMLDETPMQLPATADDRPDYIRLLDRIRETPWPLPNVWLGVSVEDQATADERIPLLLQTPAAKRFVSYEPALGPVDFGRYLRWAFDTPSAAEQGRVDWIIVGGESGPGARPFDVAWARSTVAQCKAAGVACFVKQLGARPTTDHRTRPAGEPPSWTDRLRDRKGGDWSEWPEDLRVREFPT